VEESVRPVLTLAALGVAGFVVFKMLWLLLLPLVGALVGFAVLAIKIALVVALVLIAIKLFKKISEPAST
jgi:hypothetical protein